MKFDGAVIREQGVVFAILVVTHDVLKDEKRRDNMRTKYGKYFPDMPVILMCQDSKGNPTYQGRKDIVQFLTTIKPSQIPWKRYTLG